MRHVYMKLTTKNEMWPTGIRTFTFTHPTDVLNRPVTQGSLFCLPSFGLVKSCQTLWGLENLARDSMSTGRVCVWMYQTTGLSRSRGSGSPKLMTRAQKTRKLLPSPSSLCLPHDRPMNRRRGAEARSNNFIWKGGRPRRWQTSVSEKPSYVGLDASFFYRIREGEAIRK